jgi:bifunctional ADP-heptose synthase (sugar kinase/adenylyltransferase)
MDAPTITKTRYLDSQYKQQLLRVDYEEKKKISNEQV